MGAISFDLGTFDPTFPGITSHFSNEGVWNKRLEVSQMYASLAAADYFQKHPNAQPEQTNFEKVFEHVLRDPTVGVPLDLADKERRGKAFVDADPSGAIANLAIATTYEHERRHFHDFLLSPYAAGITAMRVEIGVNAAQVAPALFQGGTTVVPVPLPRWLRKTANERAELTRMWRGLLGPSISVVLPDLTSADLLSALENIARRYQSIGVLFASTGGAAGLSPSAIFEASAVFIQIQAIHDVFGPTACNLFTQFMAEQDLGSRYPWVLRVMSGLLRPGEPLENNTLTALVTWCLLGQNNAELRSANPVIRMMHVIEFVKSRGFPSPDAPAREIFRSLDKMAGVAPYTKCLKASVKLADDIIGPMSDGLTSSPVWKLPLARATVEVAGYLLNHHKYMVSTFLSDPDCYCKPTRYLDENIEKWPEPPMRHTFGQPFLRVPRAELPKYGKYMAFDENDDEAVLREFVMQHPKNDVDLDAADSWNYICNFTDTLFAEFNRDRPEFAIQREQARRDGIFLLEVLD